YDSVPHALLHAGADLQLYSIAELIEWKPGEAIVHVRFAVDGSVRKIAARHLIITVPLGVLQANAIQFEPEPLAALEAARSLAFGQVMRVTLRFERAPEFFRPGFLLSD